MKTLPKFTLGIGDRFAHQGQAQLAAFAQAKRHGASVSPVWNKSNREHLIVHSEPATVREEADAAVRALGWTDPYFVDADHIGLATVDKFLPTSDFFTLDVADFMSKRATETDIALFVVAQKQKKLIGRLDIPGVSEPLDISQQRIETIGRKYLSAAQEAGRIYRRIEAAKGAGNFVTEVSMDETDQPQTPVELLFILAALAMERIPLATIAPKFTGRFNKGVDYVGDLTQFERELRDDLAVIAFAVREFGLPAGLKLSVHSGSDKFSLYGPIRRALAATGAGIHVKTAGTTWLEELIGLAAADGDGLEVAKEIYRAALGRFDELCAPYSAVIDIDTAKLPSADEVARWSSEQFVGALRHDQRSPQFNPHLRQLLHVGYKVAAQLGPQFTDALDKHASVIAENVKANIYERHLRPLFVEAG